MSTRTYCKWCETPLSPSHIGPCPKCGKTVKKSEISASPIATLTSSYTLEIRREFLDENPLIKWLTYILSFGSPLLGFFLQGIVGVFIGLFISIISWLLMPYAVIKVREIKSIHGD